jgi:hypothetical protein
MIHEVTRVDSSFVIADISWNLTCGQGRPHKWVTHHQHGLDSMLVAYYYKWLLEKQPDGRIKWIGASKIVCRVLYPVHLLYRDIIPTLARNWLFYLFWELINPDLAILELFQIWLF